LTRKGRMLAAIRREAVDRCPHATYNIHPYGDNKHMRDTSYAEILNQIRASGGVAVKAGPAGVGTAFSRPVEGAVESSTETDGDKYTVTTTIHSPKGDLTSVMLSYIGRPGMVVKHFIESDDDIEKYLSLPYEPPVLDLSGARSLYEAIGDRGIVLLCFDEPMYHIASLFHFEDFCVRTLVDLPAVNRMVAWAAERALENMKLLVAACGDLDCVFHASGPELCTPPMIPPSVFAALVTPYLRQMVDAAHQAGKPAAIHCHGRVRQVFEEIVKTGADMLEPIEPTPQGDIDLAELMELATGRIALMGHVQDQDFYTAPPGYMTKWVEHIAGIVNGRTGYIMSPTCTPFDLPCTDTYRRNYMEWLTAADRIL